MTAGPTEEPLDPVRCLTNRSSGKTGYALARAAARRGAQVALVSGPVALPAPDGVRVVRVRTARDMLAAAERRSPRPTSPCSARPWPTCARSAWRPAS